MACVEPRRDLPVSTDRIRQLLSTGPLPFDHAITFRDEEAVQSALPLIIDPLSDNSAGNTPALSSAVTPMPLLIASGNRAISVPRLGPRARCVHDRFGLAPAVPVLLPVPLDFFAAAQFLAHVCRDLMVWLAGRVLVDQQDPRD